MASLADLPEELLERIFEHLAFPIGARFAFALPVIKARVAFATGPGRSSCADYLDTIHNVSSTSKLWHRIAWPILYRALPHFQGPMLVGRHRGAHYFRTLFMRPECRGALQYLTIDLYALESRQKHSSGESGAKRVEDAIRQQVADLFNIFESGNKSFTEVHSRLMSADEASIMALILLLCPNITRPDLYYSKRPDTKHELLAEILAMGAAIRRSDAQSSGTLASIQPRILENLRVAKLFATGRGYWDEQFIRDVMALPALEELTVEDVTQSVSGFFRKR